MKSETRQEPLAVREREAARILGVSQRTLWGWERSGRIRAMKIGGTKLYPMASLEAFLAEAEKGGAQ